MKLYNFLLLIITISIIIYLYRKNSTIEKLTNIDSGEILQKLSSIYNGDTLSVKKLTVTESANIPTLTYKTCTGDNMTVKTCTSDNMNVNNSLTSKNINTYNLHSVSGDNSWIDIHSNCHIYKKAVIDKDTTSYANIYTRGLEINGTPSGVRNQGYEKNTFYNIRFGTAGTTRSEADRIGDKNRKNQGNSKRSCYKQNGILELRCF